MMNFEAYTLFSSSKGNSLYIRTAQSRILIDAGKSMKAIETALAELGTSLAQIDALFITHAHSDHTKGLAVISAHHDIPVHMTYDTAAQVGAQVKPELLCTHDDHYRVDLGDVTVRSFVTPHDSEGSVGYIIDIPGSYRLGICTDTGCISKEMAVELVHCDGVIIEANYDDKMLQIGPYPYYLKKRISANTGHLSNAKAAEFACLLANAGVKKIMLGHISPENNLPELALKTCCKALLEKGFDDVDITVADRYSPTRF